MLDFKSTLKVTGVLLSLFLWFTFSPLFRLDNFYGSNSQFTDSLPCPTRLCNLSARTFPLATLLFHSRMALGSSLYIHGFAGISELIFVATGPWPFTEAFTMMDSLSLADSSTICPWCWPLLLPQVDSCLDPGIRVDSAIAFHWNVALW